MVTIVGICLPQRIETASLFQEILSKYGCYIRTRLGIHNLENSICAPDGVIILDVVADNDVIESMSSELRKIESLKLEIMYL